MYKLEKDYKSNVNFYDEKGIFNDPPAKSGKRIININDSRASIASENNSTADRSFGYIKKEKPVTLRKQLGGKDYFQSQIGAIINNSNLTEDNGSYGKKRPEGVRDLFQSQIKNLLYMK
jgi:hypothetical protein